MRFLQVIILALAVAGSPVAAAQAGPSPDLEPRAVIGIVLEALAHPDRPEPDAGIARTFRFASPANRAQTGPLPRFIRLVRNPVYAPLLGHQRAVRGELVRDDGRARERVRVIAADGSTAAFVFVLARQASGPCEGCWMTDAVVRVQPEGVDT